MHININYNANWLVRAHNFFHSLRAQSIFKSKNCSFHGRWVIKNSNKKHVLFHRTNLQLLFYFMYNNGAAFGIAPLLGLYFFSHGKPHRKQSRVKVIMTGFLPMQNFLKSRICTQLYVEWTVIYCAHRATWNKKIFWRYLW